jgi:hypothetical protein
VSWFQKNIKQHLINDVRISPFKSSCRKCTCMHPLDSNIRGYLHGCICNPAGRRGECGRYVPTDNLEYLEYLSMVKEEENNGR